MAEVLGLAARGKARCYGCFMLRAAELKARHPLSLADAWIAACALERGAVLMHKDPEFNAVGVEQEVLPLKQARA